MSSQQDYAVQTKILEAARELAEETAVPFTMDQLAAKAGVSRATLYRQFGGKKAILQRLATDHGLNDLTQPNVRNRILHAARTLFAQQGMMGPTMEQIAAEANVGVASVYRHFGDRTGLLRSFFQANQPRLPLAAAEMTGDLTKDLTRLVTALVQFILENQDMIHHSFSNALEWRDEMIGLRPFHERSLGRIAAYLQVHMDEGELRGIDPQRSAAALLGMILSFTVVIPIYYKKPNPDAQETAEFITNLFLDGLKNN